MKWISKLIAALLAANLIGLLAVAGMLMVAHSRAAAGPVPEAAPEASISETAPEDIPEPENEEKPPQEPEPETQPEPESEPLQEPEVKQTAATLAFTGDILLDERVMPGYDAQGISALLDGPMLEVLTGADITMVNQEFPFSTRGTKAPDKQYTFRVNPKYVKAFQEMGADIVSLANNHALDFGREALSDTFATLEEAGIRYAGAGETKERAKQLQTMEVNGKTFGFLAASRVIPVVDWNVDNLQPGLFCTYDQTQLVEEIQKARETCDFVTVFVHWGKEKTTILEQHQTQLAHAYIDAGADLVIGSHPHILQGIEYYQGKPIFYSLGNFIFGRANEETAAVQVAVDSAGEAVCRIVAATASNAQTRVLEGDAAQKLYDRLEKLSPTVAIAEDGTLAEK